MILYKVSLSTGCLPTFFINSTNLDSYNLDIFNSIGQIIYTETIHQETKEFKKDLNLGLFGKGIYIIKLTNLMSSKSVKVIVD